MVMSLLPSSSSEDRSQLLRGSKVILCQKTAEEALNDYMWAKDPELARFDAMPPFKIPFPEYLADYTRELRNSSPRRCRFAIKTLEGKHIGNCTYYDIDEDKGEAEVGIMIGDRSYWSKGYGTDAVTTLVSYIFHQTKLDRVYLKTLRWNTRAQRCFEKCGFVSCGHLEFKLLGYDFLRMDISRSRWQEWQQGENGSKDSRRA